MCMANPPSQRITRITMINQSKLPITSAIATTVPDDRSYDSGVGKSEVRIVLVPRAVTATLLLAVSVLIAGSVYWLSGRATMHERLTMTELLSLVRRYDR